MKDNKIDSLFKENLHDMEKSPRPIAWEKINAGIKKEKSTPNIIWWQRAAIIMIICLSGFLIFYKMDGFKSQTTLSAVERQGKKNLVNKGKENFLDEDSSANVAKLADAESVSPNEEHRALIESEDSQQSTKEKNREPKQPQVKMYATSANSSYTDEEVDNQQAIDYKKAVATSMSETQAIDKPEKSTPPITVEFKSGKKALRQTLLADNKDIESNEDQSFSLKKLILKVKEVKEGELGLAELRQAKDDLFAFDTFK